MTTTAGEWHDARLNARLKVALLAALILHAAVLIAVQLRAAAVEQPRGPITIRLQPPPAPPAPPPAPKSAAAPRIQNRIEMHM